MDMSGSIIHAVKRRRRLAVAVVVALAMLLLLFSLLPVAVRLGAVAWLQDHGAPQAEINDVDLNLFTGTFAIEGLAAGDGLKVGRLAITIDWWPMWERRLFVRSVEVRNVHAVMIQSADGGDWRLSSIQFPRASSGSATAKPDAGEPWKLVLNDIDVADVSLKANGKVNMEPFDLSLLLKSLRISLAKAGQGEWLLKNRIKIGRLAFNGLGYVIENGSLQLDNTLLMPGEALDVSDSYHLKRVAVHDLQALIKRVKETKTATQDTTRSGKEARKPSTVAAKADEKKELPSDSDAAVKAAKVPKVYIEEFLVGEGSTVVYRDESLSPPFETKVTVEKFTFAPVDLSGKEKGNLDAMFKLNKNGSMEIQGELLPSAEAASADLKVSLKNFDMPRLSGFVEPGFGHSIKTGQFNMTSSIKAAENRIDAKNRLVIRKLSLEQAAKPAMAEKRLGMPVNMALDMLRDSRGDISLDVPISGRLDNPDIGVSDAINKALVKAMSAGALAYAKLALQPYGAIIMAVEVATGTAQKASRPKLTPIRFNERSATLETEMQAYTQKISMLMKQKDFRLQICGIATRIEGGGATPDRPVIMDDEKLLMLAEARSDAVLKAIQDQGVAADRLFNCQPRIDEKTRKSLPRVELILD